MDDNLNKRIKYLSGVNKELLKELTRFDMQVTAMNSKLVKQQRTIDLLIELQHSIAISETNEDFLYTCARLISSHLNMSATYIYLPEPESEGEFTLLPGLNDLYAKSNSVGRIEKLQLKDLPPIKDYILANSENSDNTMINALRERFDLASFIFYAVRYNETNKLFIISGINRVDNTIIIDLNEIDVKTIEAVGVLISSYLRKTELIQITEADKIKTEFVTNLSHEFRTPLTLITCLMEEIIAENTPLMNKEARESFDTVIKNTNRIRELIDQLLDISKLETQREKLVIEEHNLSEFLTSIYQSFTSLARKNDLHFSYSFSAITNETWYDADKVEKILSNLLTNAIKYTESKIVLSGEVLSENERTIAVFSVKDNGPGIPKEEKEKIFNRFYRIEKAEQSTKESTGIGLYFVKKLLEIHNGTLELISSKKGSEFIIKIPVARAYYDMEDTVSEQENLNETHSLSSTPPVIREAPGSTILVVEDNTDLNAYISRNLMNTARIVSTFNGKEGLDAAISEIPDLILSDVMMPEMNGIEMLKRIRGNQVTRHIPVIMLTAKAGRESKIDGLESGADDYITKPFDKKELLLKAKNLIKRSASAREKFRKYFSTHTDGSNIPLVKDQLLKDITTYLKENCHVSELKVDDLAVKLNISRTQLYRKTEVLTGYKPAELLRIIRLNKAASMFNKGHTNVAQVMYEVGINNQSNFAKNFRKQFAVNPSEYIKSL